MSDGKNKAGNSGENNGPVLIDQPHGGALLSGGVPGNKGGTGRPPSVLREKMRGTLQERLHIAAEIADDESATNSDRMRALDFLAKYGLGTKVETTGVDDAPISAILRLPRADLEKLEEMDDDELAEAIGRITGA